ncbi:phosphoribosylanthranilate isomerase [Flavisolibacter ginsenosidimutans]|uniref:N-(5'-phosphoribosyl)anthranilate isomerase n=1 Tax=Flavisolibacter ginsenosidimutans TaxID=661481 RepID=A0A5B8UNW8_9BACT|nr:phosphoribosylanthranilate isomerase [Flavisolibacter ginsenosidimutans]QEC58298.1 phosphoribosylanthranilate isomerase [Flavisolibacter ginsenosidimutans]
MKVKVCGITQMDQLTQLPELGVNYAGFIFYAPSPRFVGRFSLSGPVVKKAKLPLYKVGVFVDATYEQVMRRIEEFGLDMVQLHGHETPYECQKIAAHIDVIKAFRFSENDHVQWTIKDFYADTDAFLFDTGVPATKKEREDKTLYGGTGRKFNWNRLKGLEIRKPFFLSGGIEPTDVPTVKEFMKDSVANDMMAVDINSRFETSPGVKDLAKVATFIKELKGA